MSSSDFAHGVTHNDSAANQIEAEASSWLIYINVAGMVYISLIFRKLILIYEHCVRAL